MSAAERALVVEGREIELDADGFLRNSADWSREVGEALALSDGIVLGPDHWWLIEFVREYHLEYGNPPLMRVAVAAWRQHQSEGSSRDLYRLFPDGPVRLACKFGGLARPDWCI